MNLHTPHYADGPVTIWHGDCIEVMRGLPDASVDAVVTDPPYGLEFMGREWDGSDGFRRSLNAAAAGRESVFGRTSRTSPEYRGGHLFEEWTQTWAAQVLRLLKPGGYLVAFGGTRTWHRLASGIEDAGFAIRDSLAWMHGQGFPKSDASLKPAFEPIVLARKPGASTPLNIDDCRIPMSGDDADRIEQMGGFGRAGVAAPTGAATMGPKVRTGAEAHAAGRWPANVLLDQHQAAALDAQSGELKSGLMTGKRNVDKFRNVYGTFKGSEREAMTYGDTGGASRFFYTSKATTDERPSVDGVAHPTVKPLDLMRWLVRLVTPKGGTVLEPFAGSGTTVEACLREGFRCIAIEREADYLPLIMHRVSKPHVVGLDFGDWEDVS